MTTRALAVGLVAPLLLASAVVAFRADPSRQSGGRAGAPACRGAAGLDFRCLERRYERLTRRRGARTALRDLARRRARSGYVRAACHQLTHRIGRVAGARAGLAAFGDGTPLCSSGYHHGVTEALVAQLPPAEVTARAADVCRPLRRTSPRSADHYNCAHGLGHGFMGVHASDVFASLRSCDALRVRWERRHCHGGVFMENLSAIDHPARPSTALRPREPLYPCTAVARRHREACFDKQTTYALYVTDSDFAAVFRLCAEAAAFRSACARGLGGDVAVHAAKHVFDPRARTRTRRRLCTLAATSQARRDCVTGAVRVMLRDLAGGARQSAALCRALRGGELHRTCLRARAAACRTLPLQPATLRRPGTARRRCAG